jgi:hypothetical protein
VGGLRCLLLAGALAVAFAAIAVEPALAAKGGNSANAHACQHGGHETLFEGETGDPFRNTGDCASHGARGGTLGQFAGQAACVQIGGTFALAPPEVQHGLWECVNFPGSDARPVELVNACDLDAGLSASLASLPIDGTHTATCFEF